MTTTSQGKNQAFSSDTVEREILSFESEKLANINARKAIAMKKTMSSTNSAKKMFKPLDELKSYGSNVASIM